MKRSTKGIIQKKPLKLDEGKKAQQEGIQFYKNLQILSASKQDLKGNQLQHKRDALKQVQQILRNQQNHETLLIPNFDKMILIIQENILRPLASQSHVTLDIEDIGFYIEPPVDNQSDFLVEVYDFYLELICYESVTVSILKCHLTKKYIEQFIDLFNTEEAAEREKLKLILHWLYAKVVNRRKQIRKAMNDYFILAIYETSKSNGLSEILEIQHAIISGFCKPLRNEHILFFKRILIPLHKLQNFNLFQDQIIRCVLSFINKDKSLGPLPIEGILRFWPFANSNKDRSFIQELMELLEECDLENIEYLIPQLFLRISKLLGSMNFALEDRAFNLLTGDAMTMIIKKYKDKVYPLVMPPILSLQPLLWSQDTKNSFIEFLIQTDQQLYEATLEGYQIEQREKEIIRQQNDQKWEHLNKQIKEQNPDYEEQGVPFKDTYNYQEYNEIYSLVFDKFRY